MEISPLKYFLDNAVYPPSDVVLAKLNHIWELCNSLSESAFECGNFDMFYHDEWDAIRENSVHALEITGWESLESYVDQMILDCNGI